MEQSKQPKFHFKIDGDNLASSAENVTPIQIASALYALATEGNKGDELFRHAILMAASKLVEDTNGVAYIALIDELRK